MAKGKDSSIVAAFDELTRNQAVLSQGVEEEFHR